MLGGKYDHGGKTYSRWGNGYSIDVPSISYPLNFFTATPICFAYATSGGANKVSSVAGSPGTDTNTPTIILVRTEVVPSGAIYPIVAYYYAFGE